MRGVSVLRQLIDLVIGDLKARLVIVSAVYLIVFFVVAYTDSIEEKTGYLGLVVGAAFFWLFTMPFIRGTTIYPMIAMDNSPKDMIFRMLYLTLSALVVSLVLINF